MCMRPCGPVRSPYRGVKRLTKKDVSELIGRDDVVVTLFQVDEEDPYEGSAGRLRTLLRKGTTSVKVEPSWGRFYKDGFRTIVIESEESNTVVLLRTKKS